MEKFNLLIKKISIESILKIHLLSTLLYIMFFLFLCIEYHPTPLSDYDYYWNVGINLSIYHKGGLIFIPYGILNKIGFTPHFAAFIVNSLFWCIFSYSFWIDSIDRDKKYLQIILTVFFSIFGLWWSGYSSMVNADFPNVALTALGFKLLFKYYYSQEKMYAALALIIMSLSVSFRLKTGIALMGLVLVLLILSYQYFMSRKDMKIIICVIVLSVVLGGGTDVYLRSISNAEHAKELQGRVQLYTGLLSSSTEVSWAGSWTPEAVKEAEGELQKPLLVVVSEHVKERGLVELSKVVCAKMIRYFNFDSFSFQELYAFGLVASEDIDSESTMFRKNDEVIFLTEANKNEVRIEYDHGNAILKTGTNDPLHGEYSKLIVNFKSPILEEAKLSFSLNDYYKISDYQGRFMHKVLFNGRLIYEGDISGNDKYGWEKVEETVMLENSNDLVFIVETIGYPEQGWTWGEASAMGISDILIDSDVYKKSISFDEMLSKKTILSKLITFESKVMSVSKNIIIVIIFGTACLFTSYFINNKITYKTYVIRLLSIIWFMIFIGIHVFFEIQARYMIEIYTICILLLFYSLSITSLSDNRNV